MKSVQSSIFIHLRRRVKTRSKFAQSVEGEWSNSKELPFPRRHYCVLTDAEVFKTMLQFVAILYFVAVVQSQTNSSIDSVSSVGEARGGYGGGGHGGGGYGGGGYGGGGHGGGYGGHGHGSISMDPVSVLGLLSLGAVLLRSILTLLTASARSLDVTDINLPLMLSDIPEAIANWQGGSHVVYERSVDDGSEDEDSPMAPIQNYLSMLRTDKRCIPHFLCEFWKKKAMDEEQFLDVVMLTTAEWNGISESAAIYDQIKKPDSTSAEFHCAQARADCSGE